MIKNNENAEICAECGGWCCKQMPGIFTPKQIGAPNKKKLRENLLTLLKTGKYSIDWWEGDPREDIDEINRVYFFRPATKRALGRVQDASWGGECALLTDSGCELSWKERPDECKYIIPISAGHCERHKKARIKKQLCIDWLEYNDVIESVLEELCDE